jgi:hypothetical protein
VGLDSNRTSNILNESFNSNLIVAPKKRNSVLIFSFQRVAHSENFANDLTSTSDNEPILVIKNRENLIWSTTTKTNDDCVYYSNDIENIIINNQHAFITDSSILHHLKHLRKIIIIFQCYHLIIMILYMVIVHIIQ